MSLLQGAIAGSPRAAPFRVNFAAVLGSLGRHVEAAEQLREALRVEPNYAQGWCNLGVALEKSGCVPEAVDAYRRAIGLRPDYPQGHHFLGNALRRLGRLRDGEAAHKEALRLNPRYAGAWGSLGFTFAAQGRLRETIECRRKVVELRPNSAAAGSVLLATMHYDPAYSPRDLLREAQSWCERHVAHFASMTQKFANDPDPSRRLRIGFISGNLVNHPEGRFLRAVLSNLDRAAFETFVYSNCGGRGDHLTGILRHLSDVWRDIREMRDRAAARLIRRDRIDVLLDLTGHFSNNRAPLLARRPAPVQAIHFGYPGTTGIEHGTWRLTDALADPPSETPEGHRAPYTTERLVRVAQFAWCYEAPLEARSIGPLPARRNGHVTFCCANNMMKVTARAVEVWSKILLSVPDSRLEILTEGATRARGSAGAGAGGAAAAAATTTPADERGIYLRDLFAGHGIDGGRLAFVGRQARARYFEWLHSSDIALDPFPYNGGVTSCDTLWMGVPLITLAGDCYRSRQGSSLLARIGLDELIARTPEQYVDIAVSLARDPDRLAAIRLGLRQRLAQSAICDCSGFAQRFGNALRSVWADWCHAHGHAQH
jgi:predicted O-linked N-acetylglucosamine transferase (SPINDLY family)